MIAVQANAPMDSVLLLVGIMVDEVSLVTVSGHLGKALIKSN
jgi:hypothetical protein